MNEIEMEEFKKADFNNPEVRRAWQMKVKSEVVWRAFLELDGIINVAKFTRRYFQKSASWFMQKYHGYDTANKKKYAFNDAEYAKIAESFRALAAQLNEYADALDKAE